MNNKNRNEVKVFSVTMTEDELRIFSEFLNEKKFSETRLSDEDEEEIEIIKNLSERDRKKVKKKLSPENLLVSMKESEREERGGISGTTGLAGLAIGAGGGAIAGASGNLPLYKDPETGSGIYLTPMGGARLGAITGTVVGVGAGLAAEAIQNNNIKRKYRKNPTSPEYDDVNLASAKAMDKFEIADGKMTREEYIKKYGIKTKNLRKRENFNIYPNIV